MDREFGPVAYNIGTNVGEIAGQTVFHCHVHVFPRYPDDPYVGFRTILKGAIFELSSLQK